MERRASAQGRPWGLLWVSKFESRGEAWDYLRSIGEQVPDSKPTAFAKSAPPTPSQAPAPAKQASGSTSPSHGDAGQSIGDGGAEGPTAQQRPAALTARLWGIGPGQTMGARLALAGPSRRLRSATRARCP